MKKRPPPKELSAPFFLLTYGDMITILMAFFVLLYAMSSASPKNMDSQLSILQGSLGISPLNSYAPMQQSLPSPSVKQSIKTIAKSVTKPTSLDPQAEYSRDDLTEPVQKSDNDQVKAIRAFGVQEEIKVEVKEDEIIFVLPSFGGFSKGGYKIDPNDPEVKKNQPIYEELARQIAHLVDYDIYFIGHTDAQPVTQIPGRQKIDNVELGFLRAVAMYQFFFSKELKDKTRITFSSQGDNVPVVPNASIDSEHRKNRRVEIHLKKIKK